MMETNDLRNSTQEQQTKTENTIKEDQVISNKKESEISDIQEKEQTESAADRILRKIKEAKIEKLDKENPKKESVEKEQDLKSKEQDLKAKEQDSKVKEQDSKAKEQDSKAKEQDSKAKEQDSKVKEQDSKVKEQDSKVKENIVHTKKTNDYSKLSKKELVENLKQILESDNIVSRKTDVENIKLFFYKTHKLEIENNKKKFVEAGGDENAFTFEKDELESEFKLLLKQYKEKRAELNQIAEQGKTKNLETKYKIIEEIKQLLNGKESLNKTFQEFRELQKQWREAGLVPQSEVKALWENYHHNVEKFYDFVKLNKELRDLDLKKNLESKIKLCEKVEELLLETMIVKAFKSLQNLHNQWRETGPVPHDKKDEIWERFKLVTTKINKKYQEHFENLKEEQKNNLKAKTLLCEKAEELVELDKTNHREWDTASKEILDLQKMWKQIGFTPRKHNNKIYSRFRFACDKFFASKREFYMKNKEIQEDNLQLKTDLCIQAESFKDSADWKKTTEIFINLQKTWKEVGPVPKKHSEEIWNRFRSSCNHFFDSKNKHYSSIDSEQITNLKLKNKLVENIINLELTENDNSNLENLKEFQKLWSEIGHVPYKNKDEIQKKYREAINNKFNNLKFDEIRKNEIKFRNRLDNIKKINNPSSKIRAEREKIINKIDQLTNNIGLWENNIGFFTKSKNANPMITEFTKKIEKAKEHVVSLRKQLKQLNSVKIN